MLYKLQTLPRPLVVQTQAEDRKRNADYRTTCIFMTAQGAIAIPEKAQRTLLPGGQNKVMILFSKNKT